MRYATAAAFRAALEERLNAEAMESNIPIVRLRKLVVFDRLIARLLITAPDRWVLKGAVALVFRLGPSFRTTLDLDLGRQDGVEAATEDFLVAQEVDLGDYFSFVIERISSPGTGDEDSTARYNARAELAGRLFESIAIDVRFGDPEVGNLEVVRGSELLGFADIPPVAVPTLSLEQHVAEKIHAYTRDYSGSRSTRVKDLIDLVAISSEFDFRAEDLVTAVQATFSSRGTHEVPAEVPVPPSNWRIPYQKMANEVGLEPYVLVGIADARRFLDPILAERVSSQECWDHQDRSWQGE